MRQRLQPNGVCIALDVAFWERHRCNRMVTLSAHAKTRALISTPGTFGRLCWQLALQSAGLAVSLCHSSLPLASWG